METSYPNQHKTPNEPAFVPLLTQKQAQIKTNPGYSKRTSQAAWKLLPLLILGIFALACAQTANLPFLGPTSTPTFTPTFTPVPVTPTPTATPTSTPTPTPVPAARIESGDNALLEGDWDRASLEFNTALNTSSDPEIQSAALLGVGRTHLLAGDSQAAADTLNSILQNYPDSPNLPEVYFNLGQAYNTLGQYTEAADAYLNYLAKRPGVVDAYVLNIRGDTLQAAGDYAGAVNDYRAAINSPSFLNELLIEIKIGRSSAAMGDYATALSMYQDVYARASTDFTKAQVDVLMGQVYTALGQMDQAYAVYQDAVNNFPTVYDAYSALLTLVEAGVPVDELNRGIVDYYAGQYGVALAAIDRYFQGGGTDVATARYYNGLIQRALGHYPAAIAEWDQIIQNYPNDRFWDKAWEQKAYTQWYYMKDYTQGIQTLLDFVSASPNHPRAGEFLFDAAQVAEQDNRLEQAADLWERDALAYPGYEQANRALFLAGITHYRLGNYADAEGFFERYLANAGSSGDRSAAYFWIGKSKNAAGDTPGAQSAWQLAANADPTGYYSERANDILGNIAPFTPPETYDIAVDLAQERAQAESWMRTAFALPEGTNFSDMSSLQADPRFQRGSELWKLGLYDDARTEFEDLRRSIQDDPVANYQLTNYLLNLGLYRTAILSARQVLNLAGMSDADTMSAPAYFNHIRFGTYYADLIISTAQKYNIHPLFLFSVVRQESAFEGFVRSSAGARGLMQIIPATGQEIADGLGWPPGYTADDLYRPLVSVNLGADYLANWRDHLGGDMYAALAAYNGGPGNAIEWQKLANGDPDLFLEIVRFDETRNYIRGIYEIFDIYRRLYERTP
jgi:soluble lytic murein transglycosylase